MSRPQHHTALTANDNDPTTLRPQGDAVGYRAVLNERIQKRQQHERMIQMQHAPALSLDRADIDRSDAPHWGLRLGVICLLASLLAVGYAWLAETSVLSRLLALSALSWTGLWTSYLCRDIGRERGANLSVLVATAAGLGIWITASTQLGLPLTPTDGAAIFAGLTTAVAFFMRSKMALLISACAALMWVMCFIQFDSVNRVSLWVLPALCAVQIFMAGRYTSGLAALTAIITSYLWLGLMIVQVTTAGDISYLQAASAVALIGFAHYRTAKAANDFNTPHAHLHITLGWIAAVLGALALQHYWQDGGSAFWDAPRDTPFGVFGWTLLSYAVIGVISIGACLRWFAGRGSALSTLAVIATAATVFASTAYPDVLTTVFASLGNLPVMPSFALVIGGVVAVSALAMAVNGARLRRSAMMFAGLAGLAAEAGLLSDARLHTPDNAVIFAVTVLCALCVSALLAADSSYPSARATRAQHHHVHGDYAANG